MASYSNAFPVGLTDISRTTNFSFTVTNIVSDISMLEVKLNAITPATADVLIISNGVFQPDFSGSNSIIESKGNGEYRVIMDSRVILPASTEYNLTPTLDGITSFMAYFTTTFDSNPAEQTTESGLRHSVHIFPPASDKDTDINNVDGFKYDETFFVREELQNDFTFVPHRRDPNIDAVPDSWFKSGIGDSKDIEPSDNVTSVRVGNIDRWTTDINHGYYSFGRHEGYLYGDEARFIDTFSTTTTRPLEVELNYPPKEGVPIFMGTYCLGNDGGFHPTSANHVYQFSSIDTDHNTFSCKYCNGTTCAYADTNLFDDRYTSEYMGKDFTADYYDNSLFGRCDSTSCPGHILDNISSNIMWDNVSTTREELVYCKNNQTVYGNFQALDTSVGQDLYGITDGSTVQRIQLKHRNIKSLIVYIGGTIISAGYTLDSVGGAVILDHTQITPVSLRNTFGYTIRAQYTYGDELVYEPDKTRDEYAPVDLNLNPLYSGISRGFLSMINTQIYPHNIILSTSKDSKNYTIDDPKFGPNTPVHGVLYAGNDFAYFTAKITEQSGRYGIPDTAVVFYFYDYNTDPSSPTVTLQTAMTNTEGIATVVYTAPSSFSDQLIYIKLTSDTNIFGTDTTHVSQDTVVLANSVPLQNMKNVSNEILIDLFAVYNDDEVLEWNDTGNLEGYRADGRKEIVYRYDDVSSSFNKVEPSSFLQEDGSLAVEPTDLVKKIVYTDSTETVSYLPHNLNTNIGAYCITSPRYISVQAQFDGGYSPNTFKTGSNIIALETSLPDYMRGVFQISDINASSKGLDGASYMTFDPMAVWDVSTNQIDPRNLGHTVRVQAEATTVNTGEQLLSLRHRALIEGNYDTVRYNKWTAAEDTLYPFCMLRHTLFTYEAYISALRHTIYAANQILSGLRHSVIVADEQKIGFDFVVDIVDPPDDSVDVEFNMYNAKTGGSSGSSDVTDPSNPINLGFFPTGAYELVGPNDINWPRRDTTTGESGSLPSSGSSGKVDICSEAGVSGYAAGDIATITVSGLPAMTYENKNTYNKAVIACITTGDAADDEDDGWQFIAIYDRWLSDDPVNDPTGSNGFTRTWKLETCGAETHIFETSGKLLPLEGGSVIFTVNVSMTGNQVTCNCDYGAGSTQILETTTTLKLEDMHCGGSCPSSLGFSYPGGLTVVCS